MIDTDVSLFGVFAAGVVVFYVLSKYKERCRFHIVADNRGDEKFAKQSISDNLSNGICQNLRSVLDDHCPLFTDPAKAYMVPTPYLCGGILQTACCVAYTRKVSPQSDVTYDREPISMDDGGTISLDWYPARQHEAQPGAKAQPIAIIIPGVCGSSQEHHVRSMAKILANEKAHKDRRYRVAVINYRGTGKTMLTSSRINGAHDTDDLNNIVQHIRRLDPGTPLVAIGFSLGANILTRYLGETKNESPFVAAVSICCPFDLEIAGRAVDARGFLNDNVFQPNLITAVKRAVRRNSEFIKTSDVGYDVDAILASKRMSEIDTLLMAKQCGYKNCWEYYRAASSVPHVDDIRTPYLAINALDDPVTPFGGIPVDKFTTNPFTALVLLKHGGHLGFFTGLKPQIWYLEPIREFFDVFAFRPEN